MNAEEANTASAPRFTSASEFEPGNAGTYARPAMEPFFDSKCPGGRVLKLWAGWDAFRTGLDGLDRGKHPSFLPLPGSPSSCSSSSGMFSSLSVVILRAIYWILSNHFLSRSVTTSVQNNALVLPTSRAPPAARKTSYTWRDRYASSGEEHLTTTVIPSESSCTCGRPHSTTGIDRRS